MSPHLSIYSWQLTNTMSILHRITGVAASVMFYAAMLGYAVAPASFAAGSVVSWMAGHSVLLALTKAAIAVPVWYHTFNGIRHLVCAFCEGLTAVGLGCRKCLVLVGSLLNWLHGAWSHCPLYFGFLLLLVSVNRQVGHF